MTEILWSRFLSFIDTPKDKRDNTITTQFLYVEAENLLLDLVSCYADFVRDLLVPARISEGNVTKSFTEAI